LKKSELYKLDILRQERLRNFIKKEEEERLRNFNMIIESHSGDDDDNNKFLKKNENYCYWNKY